jgi:hypothetical protein
MKVKGKSNLFAVLNMLGCVGWLDEAEERVVADEKASWLSPVPSCRKTCGWTHCNTRCSLHRRDSQIFSGNKLHQ